MKNDIHRSADKPSAKTNRLSRLCLAVFLFLSSSTTAFAHPDNCTVNPDFSTLPEAVLKTRADLLETAFIGRMPAILDIAAQNETYPIADFNPDADFEEVPIFAWIKQSQGTEGLFVLAQMIEILNLPFAKKSLIGGVDLYVWPYLAEEPDIRELCHPEKVDLLKIATPTEYKQMFETGLYIGYQLAITTDGTWQYFARKNLDYSPKETNAQ